jgi:chemotaxis methyl-accepting protein methylase
MSRAASTSWVRRVRKRARSLLYGLADSGTHLEQVVADVSARLKVDPAVLLGSLAGDPVPDGLWTEMRRALRLENGPRLSDWQELTAAAAEAVRLVNSGAADDGSGAMPLACWVVEPSDAADAYAVASCLILAAGNAAVQVIVTHADPVVAEIGRTGLAADGVVRIAPERNRQAHFRRLDRCWQAGRELRSVLRFETADTMALTNPAGAPQTAAFDLVVSRGFLSRLCPEAAERVLKRVVRRLRHEGFLLVGPGEHDLPALAQLDRHVAPGVLLHRKRLGDAQVLPDGEPEDFTALLIAVEDDPTAWEPRWRLARMLMREGHAEPALVHLREVARQRPDDAAVWTELAQAYTLVDDLPAAEDARRRAAGLAVRNAA